ncbi:MAG: hypothetical protein KF802_02585 [Bdellovibrionaceae bacterium]|nr:hypothetical protein [Pseudobdellovibrionaceae bacterium]
MRPTKTGHGKHFCQKEHCKGGCGKDVLKEAIHQAFHQKVDSFILRLTDSFKEGDVILTRTDDLINSVFSILDRSELAKETDGKVSEQIDSCEVEIAILKFDSIKTLLIEASVLVKEQGLSHPQALWKASRISVSA